MFAEAGSFKYKHKINGLTPLHDIVLVRDMSFEARKLSSGILLLNDDGKSDGIRPRWARVFAVGPEQKEIKPGEWVYVEHGRWSRGIEVEINDEEFVIRRVDPACIIFASPEPPEEDDTISTALDGNKKSLD